MSSNNRHACPAPGCDRLISDRFLMCKPHWDLVPRDIAQRVNRAWWAYCNGPDRRMCMTALGRYRIAEAEAIEAVRQALTAVHDSTLTPGKDVSP